MSDASGRSKICPREGAAGAAAACKSNVVSPGASHAGARRGSFAVDSKTAAQQLAQSRPRCS